MSDFCVEINNHDPNGTIIKMIGEFKGKAVHEYESELLKELSRTEKNLTFNMNEVPYLDSLALGFIMKCAQRANSEGKTVIVSKPSTNVLKVLKLTNIEKSLSIEI